MHANLRFLKKVLIYNQEGIVCLGPTNRLGLCRLFANTIPVMHGLVARMKEGGDWIEQESKTQCEERIECDKSLHHQLW
jgi:hypothetical protein